mmetsp:Transcript_2445/g.5023  ORF Transcript_2445/g.5023 Transcript_2445/m.5023 type:complete len:201 (-) Transcript_2445:995-1597(-)
MGGGLSVGGRKLSLGVQDGNCSVIRLAPAVGASWSLDVRDDDRGVVSLAAAVCVPRFTRRLGKRGDEVAVLREGRGEGGELRGARGGGEALLDGARRDQRHVAVVHVVKQPVRPHHHRVAALHPDLVALRVPRLVAAVAAQLVGEVEVVLLRLRAEEHLALAHHHEPAVADVRRPQVGVLHRQDARRARALHECVLEGFL